MFPIRDEAGPKGTPWVTYSLIVANAMIFFFGSVDKRALGVVPYLLWHGEGLETLFTSLFLHADTGHLLINMWFLWVFGDNVELTIGKGRFLLFYVLAGAVAGLLHSVIYASSIVPTIGASGAIAGVIGAYMALYPKNYVLTLVGFYLLHVPAYYVAGLWFAVQFVYGIFSSFGGSDIAYWAHVGGFLFGYTAFRKLYGKKKK